MTYAEDANYWKTSTTSPGVWLDRAQKEIEKAGGIFRGVTQHDETNEYGARQTTYTLTFSIGGREMRVTYQTLPSKWKEPPSSLTQRRIQAATALYYDVKARCVDALFKGVDHAFLPYIIVRDGKTVHDYMLPALDQVALPQLPPPRK